MTRSLSLCSPFGFGSGRPGIAVSALVLLALGQACTGSADSGEKDKPINGGTGATGGTMTTVSTGGSTSTGGSAPTGGSGTGAMGTVVDGVETALPLLPTLTNVTSNVVDDHVSISFDPYDGARDYRVYVLPNDADISADGEGRVTVQNGLYRCAGDRQAPRTVVDNEADVQGLNIRSIVEGREVQGYTRTLDDATLGYVYPTPGDGRVPVYALGDSAPNADNDCDFLGIWTRWGDSRAKRFTTSETERDELLADRWRDDGIAFYVPASAAAGTVPIYMKDEADDYDPRLFYTDGPEHDLRGGTAVFQALGTQEEGTQPLMRLHYTNACGKPHDVLTVGKERFNRARYQGDSSPVFDLRWTGITAETTLVVEALADGCPYQGFLAPVSQAELAPYPKWMTFDELKTASPTGEVFINGQHEGGTTTPLAVARSFIKVSPGPAPDMDWFAGFHDMDDLGNLQDTQCGVDNCWQQWRLASDKADVAFMLMETDRHAMGPLLGQLMVTYGDVGADVNGKFRITPTTKATLAADSFVHATMTVDTFTTGRRYPQIIISEADAPVQNNMENFHALVFQTFGGWPNVFQLEVCDHQFWDVNNQCPAFDSHHIYNPDDPTTIVNLYPHHEVAEHSGIDRGTVLDVYVSSERAYWMLDGEPFGCADLPDATVPAGPVTVSFGDVLYHSGVDLTFAYTAMAQQVSTRRHYDNLGFKSGVAAPAWDENRFPCANHLQ